MYVNATLGHKIIHYLKFEQLNLQTKDFKFQKSLYYRLLLLFKTFSSGCFNKTSRSWLLLEKILSTRCTFLNVTLPFGVCMCA